MNFVSGFGTFSTISLVGIICVVFNTAAAQDITITCGDRFGGNSFTDEDYFNNYGYPTKIKVWHGDYVDAIQLSYGGVEGPKNGGDFANEFEELDILPGQYISDIVMRNEVSTWGEKKAVCQVTFVITTAEGTFLEFGPFGDCSEGLHQPCDNYELNLPLRYLAGTAGYYIDYLEPIFDTIQTH